MQQEREKAEQLCKQWLKSIRVLERVHVRDIDFVETAKREQWMYSRFTGYCARQGISHNAVYLSIIQPGDKK